MIHCLISFQIFFIFYSCIVIHACMYLYVNQIYLNLLIKVVKNIFLTQHEKYNINFNYKIIINF